jgi:malate dehydrogenase (oxaloacetate-decarboxylating)
MTSTGPTQLRGVALLHDAIHNKGTAFTADERRDHGLDGLLPPAIETLEQQVVRVLEIAGSLGSDLDRHFFLRELQERNETLFHRVLVDHLETMLPIVYTPTVGLACERYSHAYRRNRGLFLSYPLRDRLPEVLRNRPHEHVDVIVVTDGERILGLGDQGAGGMAIPIGKLALYTAVGGVRPERTLPVLLDVGTNNPERLADPQYVGWRHERVVGEEYDAFVESFVAAVEQELPGTLLQWEDFSTAHARPLLSRYRDRLLSFNDDVQGTAVVTAGALSAATRLTGARWRDQVVVVLGAGSAAVGVADMVRAEMLRDGADAGDLRRRILLVDVVGLLTDDRTDLSPEQAAHAAPAGLLAGWDLGNRPVPGLAQVVQHVAATALVGLSTASGAFDEAIVREMASKVERPVVLPLSNPTSQSEADPADVFRWTDGRALVATGSPYPPLAVDGRAAPVSQCNNVFVFPAVGLGVVASGASRVTDGMLAAAATALGRLTPTSGSGAAAPAGAALLPPVAELRHVAVEVAAAVAGAAVEDGVAPPASADELHERVVLSQWWPEYT